MSAPGDRAVAGLRSALGLLTVFGGAAPPKPGAVAWFPLVGAVLGLLLGFVWWVSGSWWPPLVAAALVVVADLALTGLLHVDGLADAGDGLLPPLPAERRLAVMAASDVGAFGVGVVVAALVLQWATLATLGATLTAWAGAMVLGAVWTVSRAAMAVAVCAVPSARPGGMAAAFAGARWWVPVLVAAPVLTGFSLAGGGVRALGAASGVAVAAAAVLALAHRRIGGVTGDVVGAAGMVGQVAGLLVASGTWWV